MIARGRLPAWLCMAALGPLAACGGDGPAGPPEPPEPSASAATAIAMVSGDDQEGDLAAPLADAFVVRVTDARGGGVGNVEVTWSVASGVGGLSYWNSTVVGSSPVAMLTAANGIAVARFTPWRPGSSTVTARADGLEGSPVTFSAEGGPLDWPPVSESALIYERVGFSVAAISYHGTLSERYVLHEDSSFRLQFLSGRSGFFEYSGSYTRNEGVFDLHFDGGSLAGEWRATGWLDSDGCLVVEYNFVMWLSDFEDGEYCRPAEAN